MFLFSAPADVMLSRGCSRHAEIVATATSCSAMCRKEQEAMSVTVATAASSHQNMFTGPTRFKPAGSSSYYGPPKGVDRCAHIIPKTFEVGSFN